MAMNKKGFAILVSLMLAVVFFILGMALAPALKDTTQEAMDSYMLNCSSTSITQTTQAVCTSIDMFLPLFVGLIFGVAGALVGGIIS